MPGEAILNYEEPASGPMKLWPTLAPLARRLVLGPGRSLFFLDSGRSGGVGRDGRRDSSAAESLPSLLLIHGLGDEADSWRHLVAPLSRRYRVIAPDLPGFGRSTWRGGTSLRDCEAAVLALVAALRLERVVPVGSSLGAAIAQRVAARLGTAAPGLVLVDGGWPPAPAKRRTRRPAGASSREASMLSMLLPIRGERRYTAYRRDHPGAIRSLGPYYADFDALPEEERSFLARRVIDRVECDSQRRAYFSLLRSAVLSTILGRRSYLRDLAALRCPMLVLWGSEDRVLPRATADYLCSIAPAARSVLLEGAGHLPQQDRPAAVLSALEEFLAGL